MAVKKETAEQAAKAKKLDMISRICATIQGKFGKESVNFLGNRKAEPMPRVPSGSVAIDKVTGGGYPLGRIVEVFGQASSGKSTACYHAIAQAQKMFPDKFCAFVDSEYSFDPIYASQCGVQVDELVVSQPDDGTEGFGILQDLIEGGAAMVVVDSVAAMVPREEMEEEDYGKSMVGTQARLMSKALRKLTSIVGRSQCCLIFTNQTRDKIGVMYGDPSCVAPSTPVDLEGAEGETVTMEGLFQRAGLDWRKCEPGVPYDVSGKGLKVLSWSHERQAREYRTVLSLIRKQDADTYLLVDRSGKVRIECSGAHRVYDAMSGDYAEVSSLGGSAGLLESDGSVCECLISPSGHRSPIVDMEVDGNANYFSNGVLSHNTTTGGKALQYYASIRLKFNRISKIEDKSGDEKMFSAIETKVESVKNKTYRPFVTATFVTVFGKGIDNDAGIIDEAVSMGVLSRKGAYYVFEGQNVAKGMAALKQYLEENPDAKARVKAAVEEAQRKELSAGQVEGGDALPPEPPPEDPADEVEGGEV